MNTKLKSFFVLLSVILGGVSSAWADETVGATDNTTNYNEASSTSVSVGISQKLHYEFTNYTNGSENYYNWLLFVSGVSGVTNPIVLRADNYWFSGDYNPNNPLPDDKVNTYTHTENIDWAAFRTNMNGAAVTIDIYNYGWWIIIRASSTNNGATYSQVMKLTHDNSGSVSAHLSVDHSHLVITESTVAAVSAQFYDFANTSTLDSRFTAQGPSSGTGGSWYFNGSGYYNGVGNGQRTFSIGDLYNGDQVVVSYSGSTATFNSTNAKTNSGEFVSGDYVISDESYYITADGTLTLNIPRSLTIYSVEITRESNTTPAITLSTGNSTLTVGQTLQTVVGSTTPTQATPTYTSSNTAVATVDQYGKVTAVGVGTATITATLTVGGSSATASYEVTVNSVTTNTYSYDFTGTGNDAVLVSSGNATVNGTTVTVLDFTNQTYGSTTFNHDVDRVAIVNSYTSIDNGNWYWRKDGIYQRFGGNRDFYILDLHNGDKVTVTYTKNGNDAGDTRIMSSNTNVTTGTILESGTAYTITADGALRLSVGRSTYVKSVSIQREESPALSFSPTSLSYELTDLNFTEPTLITQPAGVGVTYQSLDETIAKIHDPNIHDVMFIKPGVVTIRATAVINGTTYTADYTVTVKASDAIMTMNGDYTTLFPATNPYSNQDNTGVLASNAVRVTTVPFMAMTFGNGSNTVLVKDFSNTKASMIIDSDGWQNMTYSVSDGHVVPQQGTFYKFEPAIDGQLTVSGVKRDGRTNSVVLVDVDGTDNNDHSNVIFTENRSGSYTLTAGSGAIAAGTTVNMVEDGGSTVIATLTYGVTGGADFSSPSSDSHVTGYTAYTAGNGVNGEPNTGTVYIIRPNYSGEIEVGVVLNENKSFYILEDGVALPNYNGITVSPKYYGTYKFAATAGKTYRIYCAGSKLGFYGFKFTPIRSYPVVMTYSFSGNAMTEAAVTLVGGHTYYLYGNTTATNGGDYQTFYLHGFTYTTNFKFPYKGVVMDGGSGVDGLGYNHVAASATYTATASSNVTYTLEYKDKDGNAQATAATIDSGSGQISGISEAGSYVVTASVTANDKTYKTYYVLTVPYTLTTESKDRISWKFNRTNNVSPMEQNEALNANADEWAVYYKVRLYDKTTHALTYINVPVRANGINMAGDNARYFDNTSGLLFKANAHEFGTTADEPDGKTTLEEKLNCQPSELTNYNYVTIYNGTSMTIPNLKAGQYVRIKWSRYSPNNGDQVTLTNLTDLNGTDMDGVSISIGAGGRVSDNGGTGYHEFKVKANGDVTFTASQDGWINIYEVDVANQFIRTDLRLRTVSGSNALNYIRKQDATEAIDNSYETRYGQILSQSNVSVSYSASGQTGTLTAQNCSVSNNTQLTVSAGAHGRFTLLQEGRVGSYLLDRCEYEIKVYEYDYTPKTYPYTWDMTNISTATGTAVRTDAALVDGNGNYKYWEATSTTNQYKMTLEPENLITWSKKAAVSGEATAISELDGLGIRPADITQADNSIAFSTGGTGVELSGTEAQVLTVPELGNNETAYLRVIKGDDASITATYTAAGSTFEQELTTVYESGNEVVYQVAGGGTADNNIHTVDFYLKNVSVKQVAVSKDTKTVTAAGYATEARDYPLDFSLANTFHVNNNVSDAHQTAYIVTGTNGQNVTTTALSYVPTGAGVMIGSGVTSEATQWPLFTTDVNRTADLADTNVTTGEADMTGNKLIGVVTPPEDIVGQTTDVSGTKYYNYLLANGGYVETTKEDGTVIVNENQTVSGVGFYLVYQTGALVDGVTYAGSRPKSNSAYLQLPSYQAIHQGIGGGSAARSYFFLDIADEATGVEQPHASRLPVEDDAFYTLQGVRVEVPAKGLYIKNGKKVYVK